MNADPTPIAADEALNIRARDGNRGKLAVFIRGNRRGIGVHRRLQCFLSAWDRRSSALSKPDPQGRKSNFCTRQLRSSATKTTFSEGHAISWIHPNCFDCLPDSPSTPSTLPSSESL